MLTGSGKILGRLARVAGLVLLASCNAGGGGSKDHSGAGGSSASSGGGNPGASGDGGFILGGLGGTGAAAANCNGVSAPGCGDGKIEGSEQCDDGNSTPGDGCSGVCQIEPFYACPAEGQPCVTTIICGDGNVGPGEACDDGNQVGGDGCAANCRTVEKGYACPTPGAPCVKTHVCGDGNVDPNEGCDDGNDTSGDGCDSRCRIEAGFKCSGQPSACTPTVCGDGKKEGAESCDDGNTLPFDGCSETCQAEPACALDSACTSTCGDGIALGSEQCDDGNLRNGDGCSSTCQIETGFTCKNGGPCALKNGICTMSVSAIFRDQDQSKNPDIEPGFQSQTAITGLVKATLGTDDKPLLAGAGCTADNSCGTTTTGFIHSPSTFDYWYHDVAGINTTYPGSIVLWQSGTTNTYVNRWGTNGAQWPSYSGITWCANGNPGDSCSMCPVGAGQVCLDPCAPWGNTKQICTAAVTNLDGNPVFFPIDKETGLVTPASNFATATIAQPIYNGNWAAEPGGALHNFGFTSEIRYWFKYDSTASATLDFVGDDDVWVFVNGTLALDLGGWHVPVGGSFTLNSASATKFNLKNGSAYQIAVFQTERKKTGSTFKLTLTGFNTAPSDCSPTCGDGVVAAGEACDLGAARNTGAYDGCDSDCTPGPHCGDGIVQTPEEGCDDGDRKNTGSYAACGPNCQLGPY
ncbi:MAG TPA: DUF4215 domain-containing protein, partial [Polyangiaceae bacterium]